MTEDALWKKFGAGDDKGAVAVADGMLLDAILPLHVSGLALLRAGKMKDGAARLRASANIPPLHPTRWTNACVAAMEAGLAALAEEFARDGLAAHPEDGGLVHHLANALHAQSRNTEALDLYDALLRANPQATDVMVHRASALTELGKFDEAEQALVAASNIGPSPLIDSRLGMFRLRAGDFLRGWRLYGRRWDMPEMAADRARWPAPRVKTEIDLRGKRVALVSEQGLGDVLQFVRYLPLVATKAASVSVLTHEPLARLLRASFPDTPIYTDATALKTGERPEACVPLLDLPGLFGTTLTTIPSAIPYLTAPHDPMLLPSRDPRRPLRVGLCWAGNGANRAIDHRRSISLSALRPLMMVPGVEWVNLRYGGAAPTDWPMLLPEGPQGDMGVTASIIAGLDLVITVDTSVAHLAGGLGVPFWVFSRVDGCWRWLLGREDSPWYPGVGTVLRQRIPGDWSHPVEEAVDRLFRMRGEPVG